MDLLKRTLYRSVVYATKVYQKLFMDFRVWGREQIQPGPKIYVTNHITSTDPHWVLPVFTEPVHIIIGPGYQSKVLARIFDYFEHINAMPDHRKTVVDAAVRYLQKGESIYTAPEGDLQEPFQLGHFYAGVVRIYRLTHAPIIPIALVAPRSAMREWRSLSMVVDGRVYRCIVVLRGPYCVNVGEPFFPDTTDDGGPEEDQRVMEELKERIRVLVEDVRTNKFLL
jgi:1-acyl-sn-glycerol-3-phosphate acyltransferase